MVSRKPSISEAVERAAEKLKYSPLKAEQARAIEGFLEGLDVFVILPTGYGKTVCYSCLPLASDIYHSVTGSIILVVSPLIALIADQISALTKRGISAASITPDMDSDSISKINEGKYSMVFLSPELLVGRWRKLLEIPVYQKLIGLVVDEAHCVLKW